YGKRMARFGHKSKVGAAGHDDIEASSNQRLMRARRPAEIRACDIETVLGEDTLLNPDLERDERDRRGDGDAHAQQLRGPHWERSSQHQQNRKDAEHDSLLLRPDARTYRLTFRLCARAFGVAAGRPAKPEVLTQGAALVFGTEEAAPLQFRNDE